MISTNDISQANRMPGGAAVPGKRLIGRSIALFVNFMLIILAYYQVKAASRSLLIEAGGTEILPYVWIGSALVLLGFIGIYNRLVVEYSRVRVVNASLIIFAALLCVFWLARHNTTVELVYLFYIFVDVFSVVLVEQFWSLSNTVTKLHEGEKSYWFVSTGGIVGGIAGGLLASALLRYTPMQTPDLLLSCAAMLLLSAVATFLISRRGLLEEVPDHERVLLQGRGLAALVHNRYLLLIAIIVCFSQLAEPVVEYQFLGEVSRQYPDLDARTQIISELFSLISLAALVTNMAITPFVHRSRGAIAGLMAQPLALTFAALAFMFHTTLATAVLMKVSDRGLSYSINRASKELLYIPIDVVNTYQVKAWIDMLGYRLFKVLGSGLILAALQWFPLRAGDAQLNWLTFGICGAWLFAISLLVAESRRIAVPLKA